jgi:hypothetical protein
VKRWDCGEICHPNCMVEREVGIRKMYWAVTEKRVQKRSDKYRDSILWPRMFCFVFLLSFWCFIHFFFLAAVGFELRAWCCSPQKKCLTICLALS